MERRDLRPGAEPPQRASPGRSNWHSALRLALHVWALDGTVYDRCVPDTLCDTVLGGVCQARFPSTAARLWLAARDYPRNFARR